MKTLIVLTMLIAGCAAELGTRESRASVSTDPLHWMVGEWDCKTTYHETSETGIDVDYSALATYTASEYELDPHLVTGEYREVTSDRAHGAMAWDDRWEFGVDELKILFNPGNIETHYTQVTTSDSARQFSVDSVGGVHPAAGTNPGSSLFGWLVSHSLPDVSEITVQFDKQRRWGSIPIIFIPTSTHVPHLLLDGRVELDGRPNVAAIYSQSDCTRSP